MIVMPANNCKRDVHRMAGMYPERIGHLHSVNGHAPTFYEGIDGPEYLPYALDNGAFPAYSNGTIWNPHVYKDHLENYANCPSKPLWALVPDVVGDKVATLARWDEWHHFVAQFGYDLAFAAQDGMTPGDIPKNAAVVFIGGTTQWKADAIPLFCSHFDRVHVGRVNGERGLRLCHSLGVESCDGTGFFRGRKDQLRGLLRYLRDAHKIKPAAAHHVQERFTDV